MRKASVLVVCGVGNNGGDGFVVARVLHSLGGKVAIGILGDPDKFKGVAKRNLDRVTKLLIPVRRIETVGDILEDIGFYDIIVDAIFGTGLARDVGGVYGEVIREINRAGKVVMSLDIPSGINGDTGRVMGTAVKADYTVTFGLPKIGNMLFPGFLHCGELFVTYISFPPALYDADSLMIETNTLLVPEGRDKAGHKGTFGKVLFIAGASSYLGAPGLAAMSFLKTGGGYSRLAAPSAITPFIAAMGSEIVMIPQAETDSGSLSMENLSGLMALSETSDMVVLGPGVSLDAETRQLVRELAAKIEKPLLLDGDGLTAISGHTDIVARRKSETILTPHLSEMSRVTGKSIQHIDEHKVDILQDTAEKLNATIILKGAHSLVGLSDRRVFINLTGNSGMATAGSGDVLAGAIAGMAGLGNPAAEAARMGTFVHGLAGDLAAMDKGEDGITAGDIMANLPNAMKRLRKGLDKTLEHRYRGAGVV